MGRSQRPYDPGQIAEQMATHGYKHVALERRFEGRDNERYGLELNIHSKQDFARHIEQTILNPQTEVFQAINNRDIYWNSFNNTIVIVNVSDPERGTCYRDKKHREEFERLKDRDDEARLEKGMEPAHILKGGHEALYPVLDRVGRLEARRGTHNEQVDRAAHIDQQEGHKQTQNSRHHAEIGQVHAQGDNEKLMGSKPDPSQAGEEPSLTSEERQARAEQTRAEQAAQDAAYENEQEREI